MSAYDPGKPTYQTSDLMPDFLVRTHPGMNQVVIPTPDAAQQIKAVEMQRGADLMFYGVIITIACAVIHGISSTTTNPIAKAASRFLEWGIVLGVASIAAGLIYKKVTEYENWIILIMSVVAGGALLYWKRDWSASKLFKKRVK